MKAGKAKRGASFGVSCKKKQICDLSQCKLSEKSIIDYASEI